MTLNVRNTVEKYRGNSDGMQYTVVFLTDQEYQDAVRDAKPYFDEEGEGKFQAYIGWGKSNLMEGGEGILMFLFLITSLVCHDPDHCVSLSFISISISVSQLPNCI